MALQTPVVTCESVTESQEGLFSLQVRIVVADDEAGWDGIDKTFPTSFPQGGDVGDKENELIKQGDLAISRYKRAKAVKKSAALASALTAIQGGLTI